MPSLAKYGWPRKTNDWGWMGPIKRIMTTPVDEKPNHCVFQCSFSIFLIIVFSADYKWYVNHFFFSTSCAHKWITSQETMKNKPDLEVHRKTTHLRTCGLQHLDNFFIRSFLLFINWSILLLLNLRQHLWATCGWRKERHSCHDWV